MINVDGALISGHDLRNDNIDLLRAIGDNDKIAPHPQLLKLFEHYKIMINDTDTDIHDTVLHKASMAWVYSEYYKTYGPRNIYRILMDSTDRLDSLFFKEFLLKVDPLLVALAFNSVSYLYFCTEEYKLVGKIIDRLKFLSTIWQAYTVGIDRSIIDLPGQHHLESIWIKHIPPFNIFDRNNKFKGQATFLPKSFITCLCDLLVAANLFKEDDPYRTIPNSANYSVYLRIHVINSKTIDELIITLQRLRSINFDPSFVFSALNWQFTHEALRERLCEGKTGYYNPIVWLMLCYLHHNGQLAITTRNPFTWCVSERTIGQAMFDYYVYHNKDSVIKFLNHMQYNKNQTFSDVGRKEFVGLIKKYREFGMALNAKELKIKRGVLVNFLAAGFGDIFCTS